VLLQKIRAIHKEYVPGSRAIEDSDIVAFMEESMRRIGAKEFTTPRDLVREFINVLNLMAQYPEKSWQEILKGIPQPITTEEVNHPVASSEPDSKDPLDRFTNLPAG
jgi:hypothetical protein